MKYSRLGILNQNVNLDFFKFNKLFFAISGILIILSLIFPIVKGYNLGIDFRGGVIIDFSNESHSSMDKIRGTLNSAGIEGYTIKEIGEDQFQIEVSQSAVGGKNVSELIDLIKQTLSGYKLLQTQFVGPSVSSDLLKDGLLAIFFSFLGIFAYLWVRYNWQFGIIIVIALFHDVLISLLFLSLCSFEVNVTTIAAILTIIGYSINNTVVLFDQVRENTKKYIKEDVKFIINRSINQVLSRSIATSLTVFLVLLSIFFLGSEVLKSFSFTLLIGVFFGTYSSICLSVPMLYYIGDIKSREKTKEK